MGKRKTIVCLETGKQFNSVENAANAIGVSSGFISRQIKAGKPIKGFYYYYAGEMLPDEYRQKIRNQKKKPNNKSRPVICLETGERFESISLVSRMLGISKSNVFHAMKYGKYTSGEITLEEYKDWKRKYQADEPEDESRSDDSFLKDKPVVCLECEERFASIGDAAAKLHLNARKLGNAIRENEPYHGLHFFLIAESWQDETK